MIKHFINLEWKQYFRSPYWHKSIGLKILMGFFAVWMLLTFLGMGLGLYPILKKMFPEHDPFLLVNTFIF